MNRWTAADIAPQAGRSFLVTGPGGLGFETALALARHGGHVILAGRDADRGAASLAAIRAQVPQADVAFELLDLASLASVHACAQRLRDGQLRFDVLVNNAGVMAPPERRTTADGFELQIGTNHLGHFALTALLLPLLRAGRATRVVNVSSIAHKGARIALDDLHSARGYRKWRAYGASKLANLLFTRELQRRSDAAGWGLLSVAAHPGTSRTELIANGLGRGTLHHRASEVLGRYLFQDAWQGALPTLYAATVAEVRGGEYFGPHGFLEARGWPVRVQMSREACDEHTARGLWELSERETGIAFGSAADGAARPSTREAATT